LVSRRIVVALGTRPEIIKLAPVIHALGPAASIVWTGQHYDPALSSVFFAGSRIPEPSVRLDGIGGESRGRQIAFAIGGLVAEFEAQRPDAVVVQGDTNTTSAAAQAAHYCGIPVVHVEAGLRSWDRAMPEEINRLVVGAVADLHCCATSGNADNLRRAGVPEYAIRVTGNTIVEATLAALPGRAGQQCLLDRYDVDDDPDRLACILDGLGQLEWPTLLPLHPRTRARIDSFGLGELADRIRIVDPVDHSSFLGLMARARVVVSDSGGVQEEVTVLKKPLVVVRNSTERPEAIEAGFAMLVQPGGIADAVAAMAAPGLEIWLGGLPCPFGDGRSGERIAAETLLLAALEDGEVAVAGV
jgi:UDP-N-acetylglucosamine 2-epimerase (non-hydrolysing)